VCACVCPVMQSLAHTHTHTHTNTYRCSTTTPTCLIYTLLHMHARTHSQALKELDDYTNLPDDLVGSSKRWREWMELERPEDEPLPGDWKRMPEFDRWVHGERV